MGDTAAQAGDRLDALYRAEQRGLTAAAWMILGSQEAAEDAVPHGFAAIGARHPNWVAPRSGPTPGAWLLPLVPAVRWKAGSHHR